MATALYLETFLENIECLPREFQRNFTLIRDLDKRVQDLDSEVKDLTSKYESDALDLSDDKRKERLSEIQDKFDKMKEYSEDKVQLTVQMYEMVDKHIRRLDGDLARFEAEIHLKENEKKRESVSNLGNPVVIFFDICGNDKDVAVTIADADQESDGGVKHQKHLSDSSLRTRRRNSRAQPPKPSGITTPPPLGTYSDPAHDVLDMPVDPNEPTYCVCHQVSFGEMIGCDNPDCPTEWFHFQCVGLTSKPKGKWYCATCCDEKEKNKL